MRQALSSVRTLLFATLFVLVFATATAANPIVIEEEGPVILDGTTATCAFESGPRGLFLSGWVEEFHWGSVSWRIPSSSCLACPSPQLLNLTAVRFRLRTITECTAVSADVFIVGATGDPQCLIPDTNRVLCGPVNVPIDGAAGPSVTYEVPLPVGCCITEDAFVLVRFNGFETCTGQAPFIATTTNSCVACDQYYDVPGLHPFPTDWCALTSRTKFWFQVDAECCSATPSSRPSWGRLKTLYR